MTVEHSINSSLAKTIYVFSDAASSHVHPCSAWAVVVECPDGDEWVQYSRSGLLRHNAVFQAELVAAVIGIQWACRWHPDHIVLIVDCKNIVHAHRHIPKKASRSVQTMLRKFHQWQTDGKITIQWYARQTRAAHRRAHQLAHQKLKQALVASHYHAVTGKIHQSNASNFSVD